MASGKWNEPGEKIEEQIEGIRKFRLIDGTSKTCKYRISHAFELGTITSRTTQWFSKSTMNSTYARKPVTDLHVMCMAFGDAWADQAPLQVTQFESDIRLADQLSKFYIEGNGGGNNFESYNLPWYFAATRTKCDAFLKRNKKGYLFMVGDEPPAPKLLADHVKRIFGSGLQRDISTRDLLTMASKTWNIFHIMIEEGSYYRSAPDKTRRAWRDLLGEGAITLDDQTKLAELIVSILEVQEGCDLATVAASWTGSTALIIRESLGASKPTKAVRYKRAAQIIASTRDGARASWSSQKYSGGTKNEGWSSNHRSELW